MGRREILDKYLTAADEEFSSEGKKLLGKQLIKLLQHGDAITILDVPKTQKYSVSFRFKERTVQLKCSCKTFQKKKDCEHCYAAAFYMREISGETTAKKISNEKTISGVPKKKKPAKLQKKRTIAAPEIKYETISIRPEAFVRVAEYLTSFMMMIPTFVYDGNEVEYDGKTEILNQNESGNFRIIRDVLFEKSFLESVRAFHPAFSKQWNNPFFYLPFAEVMKGHWFLKTIRKLQEENYSVRGMESLKKFRYNTASPELEMKTQSSIDWFDMKVRVRFGNIEVPLRDLQKAVRSGEKVVMLSDGTLGALTDEWMEEYGMLLKMGEEKDGTFRINKRHFQLLHLLRSKIDNAAVLKELEEKKRKLEGVDSLQAKPMSKKIKASLRPYQLSGFHWMQTLDELGWGGCLADDMGLGKTLQAICFLQFLKDKNKDILCLIVCPTSLIYNWESELKKFAPTLKFHIHHGTSRVLSTEHQEKTDIVITSYGTMRSDIEKFQKIRFDYVVLDESQNIKNPDAQVTKAAQLLQAGNKMILSGTPVQNNTFDLFSQMNFLNPGFLGTKEFFKAEFAVPIDKNGSQNASSRLKKMVYPFLLRRTKEQVAPDLPDKTESVLWCQMGIEQQKVYNRYKNYYRTQLMEKIDAGGLGRSSLFLIEGLLRLRQICDSPLLLKNQDYAIDESIKIELLLHEILENTGDHKVIIFSQFTQMLSLIQKSFNENNITHLYLDGATPAMQRQDLVNQFQNDKNIKAFLISLKAGGVGLTLTAADYVYLVDPWWNPAAEDQAIDRTHRIGQTQKVFAYRMICKDTVEEKILQLQQKKKAISKELISEEKSFVKTLTREDVEFLFE